MNREEYQRYLASREWALLKEQVRTRSKNICERCRRAPYEQTHHVTYERMGNERLDDLLAVCAACHQFLSAKSHVDPARCTMFLCGPVTETPLTAWQTPIAERFGHDYDFIVPVRSSTRVTWNHGMVAAVSPSDIVSWNTMAMAHACVVMGYLDHGNRVGTVVELILAAKMNKTIVLIDNSPLVAHKIEAGACNHGGSDCCPTELTEAWYLQTYLNDNARYVFEGSPVDAVRRMTDWGRFRCVLPHRDTTFWSKMPSVNHLRYAA